MAVIEWTILNGEIDSHHKRQPFLRFRTLNIPRVNRFDIRAISAPRGRTSRARIGF